MVKTIIINVAMGFLLIFNVVNMVQSGVSILNATAVIVSIIYFAMNIVDRLRDD